MAKDAFGGLQGLNLGRGPFTHAFAITAHDTNELPSVTRAIYVGGAGNIAAVLVSGDEVTLNGAAAGSVLELQLKQVKSTGTSATNLVGLY